MDQSWTPVNIHLLIKVNVFRVLLLLSYQQISMQPADKESQKELIYKFT